MSDEDDVPVSGEDGAEREDGDPAEQVEDLVETAETSLSELSGSEANVEEAVDEFRKLWRVAEEAQDLLENIDFSELPDAIDEAALVEAIEAGDVPKAIENADAKEAVNLRALIKAINLRKLLHDVDIKQVWTDSRELKAAIDDVSDGSDDGGGAVDAASAVVGGGGGEELLDSAKEAVSGDKGDDEGSGEGDEGDEGLMQSAKDATEDLGEGVRDEMSGMSDDIGSLGNIPDEGYQLAIQRKALEGVDKFREGVLEAHDALAKIHEQNRKKMRRQYDERAVDSRNPTAHSTIPIERSDVGGKATHYSTMPRDTKYSSVPNREHIYGHRFDKRRRKK